MNPADVMRLPVGVIDTMDVVIRDEQRAQRRAQARAKSRGRR